MGRLDFNIDDKLEDRFRKTVVKRLGFKRGNITIAITEAVKDWCKKK